MVKEALVCPRVRCERLKPLIRAHLAQCLVASLNHSQTLLLIFPYTRYGYITGKVRSVSFDAIEDPDLGLIFSAIVTLDKDYLEIENNTVQLTAGMSVSVEINTDKRKIIDYLLSPLKTKIDSSFKER